MKIAMPIQEKSMEASIHDAFGRAPYFLLYNTTTKENEFLDHRAAVAQGGSGIRAAQVVADNGVRAVITRQCGENAQKFFSNAEVLVYEAIPGSIQQNIEAFLHDQLHLMSEFKSRKND